MSQFVSDYAGAEEDPPLIGPYQAAKKAYDEAYDDIQQTRLHWQPLFTHLDKLKDGHLEDLQKRAQRILRDDGATYDLKNDPLSPTVWSLDVLPNIIDQSEWQETEKGLAQRSELFDLILKDIYGEQRLIKDGVIPAEIIYSHPGFLRQCYGIDIPGLKNLIFHSIDLVRDSDGSYVVISDRTQAPSGAGYALENRTVISRVLPSVFRRSNVRRLSSFFQTMKNTLSQLAAHKTDPPRIVLLTPGSGSSTYFEHTYLANYLGYPLVQAGDLTVRSGKVWLKSLSGLTPVDVILRRTDDNDCDQSELRPDSFCGIPGLLEAARSGNVVLANPLGSAVLESPVLMAFLPKICEYLLGKPLKLHSVDTYWCGIDGTMEFVTQNLQNLIIKPAYRKAHSKTIYGHCLSAEEKVKTLEMIKANPKQYVAQTYIPGSTVPVCSGSKIKRRHSLLKAFTVADGNRYCVMPGALSRVTQSDNDYIVTSLSGARSKDTWITANEPDLTHQSLLDEPGFHVAQHGNVPSRVVENFFWFGRYAERAELSIRLMRVLFKQLNGIEELSSPARDTLLKAISLQTNCLPGFVEGNSELLENPEAELADLVVNGNRIGSIKSNLLAMLSCSDNVRDRLSADTRIVLNKLRDNLNELDRAYVSGLPEAPEESLDNLMTMLLALSGLSNDSMLRGQDWIFQQIGQRTERAIQTAKLFQSTLSIKLESLPQQQVLESVLLSMEALISFRRRYRTRTRVAFGLDLLMVDPSNPRSLVYQTEKLKEFLDMLPDNHTFIPGGLTSENRLILQTLNDIQLTDLEQLSKANPNNQSREEFSALMNKVIAQLEQFTSLVSDKYFDHTAGPQQLIKPKWKLDV
ncbi:circularly permuted type 2 ATP-grasp protein [Vibrio sp. EA2]|uniref:circularly permuted type 2 ATP-grasp protein n=1 Tax=Vibrio sp. EA2 TaxID=3079860 RepID=UPI002949BC9D|nr:circularly permuted type 2 ATP-grasp protein [Vibrio sp. EA2]MDV6251752.1 circularly permuted type 2 ATP-grasp protein [Vibrio sp. EA2]